MKPRLYIATNGLSVWYSDDLGESLLRTQTAAGLYSGAPVWGLAYHPSNSGEILCGTSEGIFRFDAKSQQWSHLKSPLDAKRMVTAIAYSPHDPNVIVAGTQPAALFRSEDGGKTWRDLNAAMSESVALRFGSKDSNNNPTATIAPTSPDDPVKHWTRVCQIVWDYNDPEIVCACVEIDDAWISSDGGRSFRRSSNGIALGDVHGMAIVRNGVRTLYAATAFGLHASTDDGATWRLQQIDSPWQYTRSIVERADRAGTMFLTNGSGAPGWHGRLYRSRDHGKSWKAVPLPGEVESSLYFLATNPADPSLMFAASAPGQFYRTTDGGETWVRLPRRLGEVRAIAWVPAAS
jgi:photosystem II stability/assembly factor-like uncharacterized protein